MDIMDKFVVACLSIGMVILIISHGFFPKYTKAYKDGVVDTYKIAYEKGHMIKEIDKDDKVIYKWKND